MILSEPKSVELHRLHQQIGDNRLDAVAAISLAIDAMDEYNPDIHRGLPPRQFLKETVGDRFMHIKNAGVAVKAVTILIKERTDG